MKDSFILYNSFYEPIKNLTNEQLGKLLRAVFDYTINGVTTKDNDILIAFMFIKNQIDLDTKKWEEERKKRSEAGRLGGINRAKNQNQKLSSKSKQCLEVLSNGKQNQANQGDNENENENVNVNVINNNLSSTVDEIINYLNQPDTDEPIRSFTKTSKSTRSKISARLKEGFTIDDFKDVIFYKYNQWVKKPVQFNNGVMSETYYRPDTLFSTNFENYLQEYREKSK